MAKSKDTARRLKIKMIFHSGRNLKSPNFYKLFLLALLFFPILFSSHAEDNKKEFPGNSGDEFLAGWYGPLTNGSDKGRWFWENNIDYILSHGFDWIWVQGGTTRKWIEHKIQYDGAPCSEKDIDKIHLIAERARVFWEIDLWNDDLFGKNGRNNADWYIVFKEPEKFEKMIKYLESEIDFAMNLFNGRGKGKLYGVILGEEEPWRCNLSRGAGKSSYNPSKSEFNEACIDVYRRLYSHLKGKYAGLRISHGFYPNKEIVGKIEYDDVVMDAYPKYPSLTDIETCVNTWKNLYEGKENDVYVLLWGTDNSFPMLHRLNYYDKVFNSFLNSGFRNIGWFDTARWANRYQSAIEEKVDILSPNTYLPLDWNKNLSAEKELLRKVEDTLKKCPDKMKTVHSMKNIGRASLALMQVTETLNQRSSNPLCVQRASREAVRLRYKTIESCQTIGDSDYFLALNLLPVLTCKMIAYNEKWLKDNIKEQKIDLRFPVIRRSVENGACFYSYPAFYLSAYQKISEQTWSKLKSGMQAMLASKIKDSPSEEKNSPFPALLSDMKNSLNENNSIEFQKVLISYCYELAKRGKLHGTVIRLVAENPYTYSVIINSTLTLKSKTGHEEIPLINVSDKEIGFVEYLAYVPVSPAELELQISGYDGIHLLDGMEIYSPEGKKTPQAITPVNPTSSTNSFKDTKKIKYIDGECGQVLKSKYLFNF
jgi:hypothetical protein